MCCKNFLYSIRASDPPVGCVKTLTRCSGFAKPEGFIENTYPPNRGWPHTAFSVCLCAQSNEFRDRNHSVCSR
jgi:hypothetical protein